MRIPLVTLAFGILMAVLASQLPEFAQQYRQRLGGAIDELSHQVSRFRAEADADKLTPEAAIARLQKNPGYCPGWGGEVGVDSMLRSMSQALGDSATESVE